MSDQELVPEKKYLYTAAELIALEVPETNFYFEPYIPTDGITMFFGKPGTYKTTIAYAMANAIATGKSLIGTVPDKTARCLIVELDTPMLTVKTRFSPVLNPESAVDTYFHHGTIDLVERKTEFDLAHWSRLRNFHIENKYGVVFIDTQKRTNWLDEKSPETPARMYDTMRQLFPGAALVFIHHCRKSGADDTEQMTDESFSGSMQFLAQCQVSIRAWLRDKNEKVVDIDVTKSQVAERTRPVRLQVDGWQVRLHGEVKIDQVGEIMTRLPPGTSKGDMNDVISKEVGCSLRTAQTRRIAWERLNPDWVSRFEQSDDCSTERHGLQLLTAGRRTLGKPL